MHEGMKGKGKMQQKVKGIWGDGRSNQLEKSKYRGHGNIQRGKKGRISGICKTLNTPIQRVYEKLRKISGRPARRISILKSNGQVYSTT